MPDQITTVAQLSGYPLGAVFTDIEGGVWMIDSRNPATGACWMLSPETVRMSAKHVLRKWGPLTPQWRPDQPVGSPKVPSKSSEDEAALVADALIQYETSGMCYYGRTCGTCDCGRSSLTVEGLAEQDAMELGRARAVLALIPPQRCAPSEDEVVAEIVDALDTVGHAVPGGYLLSGRPEEVREQFEAAAREVGALYGAQPTVEQAKAEGIREACDQVAGMLARQDADAPFSIRVTDLLEALARQAENGAEHG